MSTNKNAVASWVFGGFLLLLIIAIVFLLPEPTKFQANVVRFFMALAAAFLSFFFVGKVMFKGSVLGQAVSATGGMALFVLIMFFWDPSDLRTIATDIAPSVVPRNQVIERAQRTLQEKGYFLGPITGKPDTQTRDAIKKFQMDTKEAPSGYIRDETKAALARER